MIVITGTIIGDAPNKLVTHSENPDETIERLPTDISVPSHFYKIIYSPSRVRALAFLLPHENVKGRDLDEFRTSIRKIEETSGYDFLSALPKSRQNTLEHAKKPMWRKF